MKVCRASRTDGKDGKRIYSVGRYNCDVESCVGIKNQEEKTASFIEVKRKLSRRKVYDYDS